jgi:hypothetical protein
MPLENAAMDADAGDGIPDFVRQPCSHLSQFKKAVLQILTLLPHLHMREIFEKGANSNFVFPFFQLRKGKPDVLAVSVPPREFHLHPRRKVMHGQRFAERAKKGILSRPEMDIFPLFQHASFQDLQTYRIDICHGPIHL